MIWIDYSKKVFIVVLLKKNLELVKYNFEDLYEFMKLVNDELRYLNELELIELNRDWSQPNKLNSSELFKYKKVYFF
jgi:hypothetical protein